MKGCMLFLAIAVILSLLLYSAWSIRRTQPGVPSESNFDRVGKGMVFSEVVSLLGPGEEIPKNHVPGFAKPNTHPDAPAGEHGMVWGERFFRWRDGTDTILVGFADGRVTSKYRWWEGAP